MILADTSAWIEFLRGTNSSVDRRMVPLVADGRELAVTDPVIMEITSGARSDVQERAHRRLLARCVTFGLETPTDFDGAATIYRRCRSVGVTPRGLIDCMIAAVARRNGLTLLARDMDLARIADIVGIELDPASLEG
ncbi:MAG: PIN domain nuclease [Actinobacteria bacterium]|nr:PIN domain nuclease [Actinomycetota bacterium]